MNVTVRLFAGLRRRVGSDRVTVELHDGARVSDLLAAFAERVGFEPQPCVVAVNREYAPAAQPLCEADEIALVPPVSGGAGPVRHVRVRTERLDVGAVTAVVGDAGAGAIVTFLGVTRDVPSLEYELYAEMAEARMLAIAEEEAARHDLLAVALEHRAGSVALGEPSVVIAVSSAHREAAFAGARAVIDRIKAEAPIWKREVTAEGATDVAGTLPPVAAPPPAPTGPPAASCD
jgi:molybdopterin synthase catalytic subunit